MKLGVISEFFSKNQRLSLFGLLAITVIVAVWDMNHSVRALIKASGSHDQHINVSKGKATGPFATKQAWPIFGEEPFASGSKPRKWKIIGIFMATPDVKSSVVVEQNGSAKRYHSGDKLPNGARLDEITGESITIFENGRKVSVPFQMQDAQGAHQPLISTSSPSRKSSQAKARPSIKKMLNKAPLPPNQIYKGFNFNGRPKQ